MYPAQIVLHVDNNSFSKLNNGWEKIKMADVLHKWPIYRDLLHLRALFEVIVSESTSNFLDISFLHKFTNKGRTI